MQCSVKGRCTQTKDREFIESILSDNTHTYFESLQVRFVNIVLVTETFICINTSCVNR
ncbi:hypothetical protein Hdeb2414_s0159g00818091 [Helianthus debilis subsp. tardiflorus]